MKLRVLMGFTALMLSLNAQAMLVEFSFTATNIQGLGGSASPIDSVDATFQWHADSLNGPATALESVSLSIMGHDYSVDELGFENDVSTGTLNSYVGVDALTSVTQGSDDFLLHWFPDYWWPYSFTFSYDGATDVYQSLDLTNFAISEVTAVSVPEPGAFALLLLGLGGLRLARRR